MKDVNRTILEMDSEIAFLRQQLAEAQEIIQEQRQSIGALNMCVGGEESTTTDNLVRVSRLEHQLAEAKDETDTWKNIARQINTHWIPANEGLAKQLAEAKKDAQRMREALMKIRLTNNLGSAYVIAGQAMQEGDTCADIVLHVGVDERCKDALDSGAEKMKYTTEQTVQMAQDGKQT